MFRIVSYSSIKHNVLLRIMRRLRRSVGCDKSIFIMYVFSRIRVLFKKYPLVRGMTAYAVIWPTSSLIQQTFEGKNIDNYDWQRCARYGFYGSCYVAPTLYSWLTVANIMWPGSTLRAGIIKTVVETLTYTPFAMCSFYFFMSLLEMKSIHEAVDEVKAKLWPTYKIGASVWPAVAMVNFCFIAPRNRVPFYKHVQPSMDMLSGLYETLRQGKCKESESCCFD